MCPLDQDFHCASANPRILSLITSVFVASLIPSYTVLTQSSRSRAIQASHSLASREDGERCLATHNRAPGRRRAGMLTTGGCRWETPPARAAGLRALVVHSGSLRWLPRLHVPPPRKCGAAHRASDDYAVLGSSQTGARTGADICDSPPAAFDTRPRRREAIAAQPECTRISKCRRDLLRNG